MSAPESAHGFANPMPAGLCSLATICFGLFAVMTGQVSHAAMPILAVWCVGGFLIQAVAAWIEFKEQNQTGSNLFLVFACFFMLVTAGSIFSKYFLKAAGMPFDSTVEGWLWIAPMLWVLAAVLTFLKRPSSLFILGIVLLAALPAMIVLDMGLAIDRKAWATFLGWDLFVAACIATYIAFGLTVNLGFGKPIVPLGNPIIK